MRVYCNELIGWEKLSYFYYWLIRSKIGINCVFLVICLFFWLSFYWFFVIIKVNYEKGKYRRGYLEIRVKRNIL